MPSNGPPEKRNREGFSARGKNRRKCFAPDCTRRVSTFDQQTLPLQIRAMREYVAKRGWTVAVQIKEVGSGATQRELRRLLLDAARRREIDVVLVWLWDRWGRLRESIWSSH